MRWLIFASLLANPYFDIINLSGSRGGPARPSKGGTAMSVYEALHITILLGSLIVAIIAVRSKKK
jgi:hypothetical protein